MEHVQQAIDAITHFDKTFPKKAFQIISEHKEQAIPFLRDAINKAILEQDSLEEGYQLHFYALFLLGQFQDRESFPLILKLASLPPQILDNLIGDAITSGLPDILYNTYNGDLALLKAAFTNPAVDEYVRGGILDVLGQLYLDGVLAENAWKTLLREWIYEEDEQNPYICANLAQVICKCHFADMLPDIRHLYEEDRIDEEFIGTYDKCVDSIFEYEEQTSGFCRSPIHAASLLRGWAMFEQPPEKESQDKDFGKLIKTLDREFTRPEPTRKIGRNDPCPCGSGKKYKFCCLNKPKSLLDSIESEQERMKWLKSYPYTGDQRETGRIYLEDFFDSESIEIDKLLYLALAHRMTPLWRREPDEIVEKRQRAYLSEAFAQFAKKVEKEHIATFKEYDVKYSIHYFCEEWMDVLLALLKKNDDQDLYGAAKKCRREMDRRA